MRVVDRRDLDLVLGDVLPDVELGPVRQRKHPDVLAVAVTPVVEIPQLGSLVLRIPLPEVVTKRVDALLRPRLLLVAPATPEHCVEAMLLDCVEEGHRLEAVAAGSGTGLLDHPPGVDRCLDRRHHELHPELGHPDRKSTRLNSSHMSISYAVFCL